MRIKILPLIISLFYVSASFAAVDEKCQQVAQKYLVKGNMSSAFGGDRLWALTRLSRDYNSDKAAECMEEVRKTALADAREYWLGYIAVKYSCNTEDTSMSLAKEKPEQCPEEKYNLIKQNVDFIENVANGKATNPGKSTARKTKKKDDCDPNKDAIAPLVDVANAASQTFPPDMCAKYGKSEHAKNGELSGGAFEKFKQCLSGGKDGLKSLWEMVKSGYNATVNMITDAEYRASVKAALSDLLSVLTTSPKETVKAIYNSLITSVTEYKSELQCMSNDEIVKELCNQLTEKGLPTLLGVGAIRGIVMAVKGGKAAATGLVVLKDASRAVEASQGAAAGAAAAANAGNSATAIASSAAPKLGAAAAQEAAKETAKESADTLSKGAKAARESRARASAKAKEQAEARAAKAQQEAEQKAREEAEKRAKEEAARAKAEAEARAKADEQAKAKAQRERNSVNPAKDAAEIQNIKNSNVYSLSDVKRVLNLDPNMSKEQVKKEIRKLTGKYHPDRNPDHKDISDEVTKKLIQMRQFTD